ncbi:ABC transporter ATP-binding protein [Weizmannia sp. FSL K6-3076]|uniref:ABC transporter ATP-binding protein n=1 Tax=Weizmannia sp. FSL K6-3076 TaxID=2954542 RepID=UPI0030FC5E3C
MIEAINIKKNFGKKKVLQNISFRINNGTIYGIVGTNGVGKTTLLKIISGMTKPSEGYIKISNNNESSSGNSKIGFVPDTTALYNYLTGEEYLYFAASILGLSKEQSTTMISKLLHDFNLFHSKDQLISNYSNGMKQKISIAAALISHPDILLLDEPLTGVDMISSNIIKDHLKNLCSEGKTVILTTHMLELAHNICHKIGILHEGILVTEFNVKDFSIKELEIKIKDIYINEVNKEINY